LSLLIPSNRGRGRGLFKQRASKQPAGKRNKPSQPSRASNFKRQKGADARPLPCLWRRPTALAGVPLFPKGRAGTIRFSRR
jgi:hypothetical protein